MKTLMIFTLITLISCCGFAQTTTGIIHYGEIQSLGMGRPVGFDYNAYLAFDQKSSLYVTRKDSLERNEIKGQHEVRNPNGGSSYAVSTNTLGFQYYNNIIEGKFKSRDIGFKYIEEVTPTIKWTIKEETKIIGNLTCTKAISTFRGRDYTAWFTLAIPLPYGPWKLQGIPGLIIEAYDTDKEIYWYFKSIKYKGNFDHLLKPIENKTDEWITSKEFEEHLVAGYIESITGSRMLTENMDFSSYSTIDKDLKKVHIEAFKVIK